MGMGRGGGRGGRGVERGGGVGRGGGLGCLRKNAEQNKFVRKKHIDLTWHFIRKCKAQNNS